ncbi:MAG: ShlB/FhaC/HecB family hemolysin secretion/activation protein [Pseudomonadota bacterium]
MTSIKAPAVLALGLTAIAFPQDQALAQASPQPTRSELEPPDIGEELEEAQQPSDLQAPATDNCPLRDSALSVTISAVQFAQPDGTALDPQIAETLAGVETVSGAQPVSVICDIRDAANEALRADGWVASIQIPPQEIQDGTVRLNVITARIVEVRLRGDAGPYEKIVLDRAERLKQMVPLNERKAESLLLLAGDIPGLDIRLSLSPAGTEPGEVIGDLSVSYQSAAVLLNAQNYYARALGREVGYIRSEFYGLTGMGDITYVGGSSTFDFEEQIISQIGHIATLDAGGTTLGARATFAESRPVLPGVEFRTETTILGFDLTRPLKRSLDSNLSLAFGFDYVNQSSTVTTLNATQPVPISEDALRIFYLRGAGDFRKVDKNGRTKWRVNGTLELRKGVDIFGATEFLEPSQTSRARGAFTDGIPASRSDARADAFVVRAGVESELFISSQFSLYNKFSGQWTDDPLLNYEEFSLGNLSAGRGYDPGSNNGDRAFAATTELRSLVPLPKSLSQKVQAQLFAFHDFVLLDNLDPTSLETNRNLESVGGGVRLTLPGKARLEVSYVSPRDRALVIDQAPPTDRVLVSLTVRFGQ